jgi:hypothetical protein
MPRVYDRKEITAKLPDIATLPRALRGVSARKKARAYTIESPGGIGYCVVHETGFATYGINPADYEESGILTDMWEGTIDAKNLEIPNDNANDGERDESGIDARGLVSSERVPGGVDGT